MGLKFRTGCSKRGVQLEVIGQVHNGCWEHEGDQKSQFLRW
jgi:hypothetical protein